MIIITGRPSRDQDGHKANSTRGPLFDAAVAYVAAGERVIVRRSHTPLLDACRVLAAEGVDPATPVAMHHEGKDYDALRSTVGAAVKLTVRDTRGGKPAFAEHESYDARKLHSVFPPVRETDHPGLYPSGHLGKRAVRLALSKAGGVMLC